LSGRSVLIGWRPQPSPSELIIELSEVGKTIVLATHDLETIDVLSDRCLVFGEDHRLVHSGTPLEILADRELLLSVNLIHERTHLHHPHDQNFEAARH
jgi:cobalt/nickel transport system ATP-binding protein